MSIKGKDLLTGVFSNLWYHTVMNKETFKTEIAKLWPILGDKDKQSEFGTEEAFVQRQLDRLPPEWNDQAARNHYETIRDRIESLPNFP